MHILFILLLVPTLLGGTLAKINENQKKIKSPAAIRRHDGSKSRLLDINKDLVA